MSAPESGNASANAGRGSRRIGIVFLALLVLSALIALGWTMRTSTPAPILADGSAAATHRGPTLSPHPTLRPVVDVEFEDANGRKLNLGNFRDKVVLLNVWATWCGPCRAEMPTLDRLQSQLGGSGFEVVALSIDRGGQSAVKSFYDEIGVRALAIYVDATAEAQTKLGILGVPTTLLIDVKGREVARFTGPAEWDRPEVVATIRQYLPPAKP